MHSAAPNPPPGVNNVTSASFSKNHQRNWPDPIGDHFYLSLRLSNRFRFIYFNQMFLFAFFFLPGPHGATSPPLFTLESALCITETWRVVTSAAAAAATRLVCQPSVCSALSRAAAASTLPLWHVSGHGVLLCLREKISVGRRFLPLLFNKHNNFTCLMACAFCLLVCVLLITPYFYRGARTTRPHWVFRAPPAADFLYAAGWLFLFRSCRDGSVFSVTTDESNWHQTLPGCSPLIIFLLLRACCLAVHCVQWKRSQSQEPAELLVENSSRPTSSSPCRLHVREGVLMIPFHFYFNQLN